MDTQNSAFIFNLGRLWEAVILERWDDAKYLNRFIKEITPPFLLKKWSKELKKLDIGVEEAGCEKVDKALTAILGW